MLDRLYDPVSLHCELVMTLVSPNIYFKRNAEYHGKIEVTLATKLEPYSQVRSVVNSINLSNLCTDFRQTRHWCLW